MSRSRRSSSGWAPARAALLLFAAAHALTADQTVTVGPGLAFSPATVTVAPGETVTWDFQALHTSTSDSTKGPEVWNSGILSSGTFSHTFLTPGTYPYYCAVHSFPGGTMMNGVIEVTGAGATPTETPSPTATPVPTAIPTQTPSPTLTRTVSPTPTTIATLTPAPLPTQAPGPAPVGIPLLDPLGRILLALALGAAGITALRLGGRR